MTEQELLEQIVGIVGWNSPHTTMAKTILALIKQAGYVKLADEQITGYPDNLKRVDWGQITMGEIEQIMFNGDWRRVEL